MQSGSILRFGLVAATFVVSACGSDASTESSSVPDAGSDARPDSGGSGSGGTPAGGTGGGSGGSVPTGGTSSGGVGGGSGGSGGNAAGAGGAAGSGGSSCVDPGPEPNESIVLATSACGVPTCNLTDCDSTGSQGYAGPLAPIAGVLSPGDIDNWRFDATDTFGFCSVDPAAKTSDSGFRLCIFVNCKKGATVVSACPGGLATDGDGSPGCCVTAPGEAKIVHDCQGSPSDDDSARVTVRVDQASACLPYSVDFHF